MSHDAVTGETSEPDEFTQLKAGAEQAWNAANEARRRYCAAQLSVVTYIIRTWFPDASHITIDMSGATALDEFGAHRVTLHEVCTEETQIRWVASDEPPSLTLSERRTMFDGNALFTVNDALTRMLAFGLSDTVLQQQLGGVQLYGRLLPFWQLPLPTSAP